MPTACRPAPPGASFTSLLPAARGQKGSQHRSGSGHTVQAAVCERNPSGWAGVTARHPQRLIPPDRQTPNLAFGASPPTRTQTPPTRTDSAGRRDPGGPLVALEQRVGSGLVLFQRGGQSGVSGLFGLDDLRSGRNAGVGYFARLACSRRSSCGRANCIRSGTASTSSTWSKPLSASRASMPSTRPSGTDAPLVSPTVLTPSSHSGRSADASSTRYAAPAPPSRATSTRRTELDELVEPTTRTRSDWPAMALTADCRFCVA